MWSEEEGEEKERRKGMKALVKVPPYSNC